MLDVEIIPHGRDKDAADSYKVLRWMLRRTKKERQAAVVNLATRLLAVGHLTDEDIQRAMNADARER